MNAFDLNFACQLPDGVVIVPFAREHVKDFHVTQPDMEGHSQEYLKDRVISQVELGCGITVLERNKVIGMFGSGRIWDNVEEAWFLVDEMTRRYGISMTKVAKKFIELKFQEDMLNRLQITVRCTDVRAHKWAKCIGFSDDGVMRQFGPDGSDYFMMSIVRGK